MAERITAAKPKARSVDGADEQTEVERLREEVLRLRDLLIARDAELGTVRGRLAEHEDRSQRLLNTAQRINSRLPGLLGRASAALRRLRGRG